MADISKVKLPGSDTPYYVKDARIAYGTCSTAAGTAAKVVSATSFILVSGARIAVKFTVTNTAANPTLNVNNTGARAIYYKGSAISADILAANRTHEFVYNGTKYELIGNLDSNNSDTYPSAYCSTDAATAAKVATCTNYHLLTKSYTHILITTANTAQSALTLNINGKGAKPIFINGSVSSSSNYILPAGTYLIYYDGINYYFRTDGVIQGTAASNHTHSISIAADSGNNQLTLAASTKYKLTAGGNSYVFTTPPTGDTHYTTHLYAGSGTAANAATTNGYTRLTIADNTTVPSSNGHITIKGTGATTVTSDANGVITINSTDNDSNTIPSAYCNTDNTTADKVASCTGYALQGNTYIHVLITKANTAQSALTLNINNRGAKTIYINGEVSSSTNYTLPAGTYLVYFSGTHYYFRTDGVLAKTSYTPAGSVTVTPTVTVNTTTVGSVTNVGSMPTYTVADEILTITAGEVPTKADTSVATGINSATATGSFSGEPAIISVKGN